jgi:hypothetical protein
VPSFFKAGFTEIWDGTTTTYPIALPDYVDSSTVAYYDFTVNGLPLIETDDYILTLDGADSSIELTTELTGVLTSDIDVLTFKILTLTETEIENEQN